MTTDKPESEEKIITLLGSKSDPNIIYAVSGKESPEASGDAFILWSGKAKNDKEAFELYRKQQTGAL